MWCIVEVVRCNDVWYFVYLRHPQQPITQPPLTMPYIITHHYHLPPSPTLPCTMNNVHYHHTHTTPIITNHTPPTSHPRGWTCWGQTFQGWIDQGRTCRSGAGAHLAGWGGNAEGGVLVLYSIIIFTVIHTVESGRNVYC